MKPLVKYYNDFSYNMKPLHESLVYLLYAFFNVEDYLFFKLDKEALLILSQPSFFVLYFNKDEKNIYIYIFYKHLYRNGNE